MVTTPSSDRKTRVFVSYSRKDSAFAERLVAALDLQGFEAFLDKKDILPGEPWKERLGSLILTADAVAFVISPESIASEVCSWEVEETERLQKRLLPVLYRMAPEAQISPRLSRLNYIFLRESDDFEAGIDALTAAIDTDIAWVRQHTRLGELSRRWEDAGRPASGGRLLRADELAEAERWLLATPKNASEPTALYRDFIDTSRTFETAEIAKQRQQIARTRRFQRWASFALVAVALLLLAGTIGVIWQDIETTRREQTVFLSPVDAAIREHRYDRAMRYALQAFPAEGAMPWTPNSTALEGKLAGAAFLNQLSFATAGHTGAVRSAKFNPQGDRFVTASDDGAARVWDIATGTQTVLLSGHSAPVRAAEFSPDGTRIVTASADGTARIWEAGAGRQLAVLGDQKAGVLSAHFSSDGTRIVTASQDRAVRVWDVISGKELAAQKAAEEFSSLSFAALRPDGRQVMSVWSNGVFLWDMVSGSVPVRTRSSLPHFASYSSDGGRILVGYLAVGPSGENAAVWDSETATEMLRLENSQNLRCGAFSPDGKTIAGCIGRTVRIWDADTGKTRLDLRGHAGGISALAFSADGKRLVTGSATDAGELGTLVHSSAPGDDDMRVWDVTTGKEVAILRSHVGAIESVSFSPDGAYVLSASDDGTARVWITDTNHIRAIFRGHDDFVVSGGFSPDGRRIVTGSVDDTARVWDVGTARELLRFTKHGRRSFEGVKSVSFSPDGKSIISSGADDTSRVWDAVTGEERARLHDPKVVKSGGRDDLAAFSPDGTLVLTAGVDPNVRLWDASTGALLRTIEGESGLSHAAFSPDGKLLVTVNLSQGEASRAGVWNVSTGKLVRQLLIDAGGFVSVAWSADSDRILVGYAERPARLFDAQTGERLASLKGYEGRIVRASLSPDGTRIVTASADTTARIWDSSTGEEIAVLRGHADWVTDAQFSADGAMLLTTSRDGTAIVWDVSQATLMTGERLRAHVCDNILTGVQEFTSLELADPFLRGIDADDVESRNPCRRRGPLSWSYYEVRLRDALAWTEARIEKGIGFVQRVISNAMNGPD